jgi:hypothetical protein
MRRTRAAAILGTAVGGDVDRLRRICPNLAINASEVVPLELLDHPQGNRAEHHHAYDLHCNTPHSAPDWRDGKNGDAMLQRNVSAPARR